MTPPPPIYANIATKIPLLFNFTQKIHLVKLPTTLNSPTLVISNISCYNKTTGWSRSTVSATQVRTECSEVPSPAKN